jgi:hypothetical protein
MNVSRVVINKVCDKSWSYMRCQAGDEYFVKFLRRLCMSQTMLSNVRSLVYLQLTEAKRS